MSDRESNSPGFVGRIRKKLFIWATFDPNLAGRLSELTVVSHSFDFFSPHFTHTHWLKDDLNEAIVKARWLGTSLAVEEVEQTQKENSSRNEFPGEALQFYGPGTIWATQPYTVTQSLFYGDSPLI